MPVCRPTLNADVGWEWLVELQFISWGVAEGADSSSCVSADAGRGAAAAVPVCCWCCFCSHFPPCPCLSLSLILKTFTVCPHFSGFKQACLVLFFFLSTFLSFVRNEGRFSIGACQTQNYSRNPEAIRISQGSDSSLRPTSWGFLESFTPILVSLVNTRGMMVALSGINMRVRRPWIEQWWEPES